MKKLELNQMEGLEGGGSISRQGNVGSCTIAVVGTIVGLALAPATFGLSTAATVFFGSISIVDGCLGWA